MDTIKALRLFVRVVELGSFTAAAHESGMTQPSASKMVAALERELGARLLTRSTTTVALTEAGRGFYTRSQAMLDAYAEAVADAQGQTRALAGALVVAAPVGLGELRLNKLMMEFLAQYPDIELEIALSDRRIDLVEEGVDLAIRLGGELPPNVVARQLAVSPRLVVAAPGYLDRAPPLERPEDLMAHDYVRYGGLATLDRLVFTNAAESVSVAPRGRYRINSSLAVRQCLLEGAGVGTALAWLVQDLIDAGDLVALLPTWSLPSQPLHVIYPSRRYLPHRTRTLLQFLHARLPRLPGFGQLSE